MAKSINFDRVSDIYDFYVNLDFDISFFLNETKNTQEEILELMCGTGRVSIPLLEAGRKLICVDYSKGMLDIFAKKAEKFKDFVQLVEMDITKLNLGKKFKTIILPFHSFSEITSSEKQFEALQNISSHLDKEGKFILTLQNPVTRLKNADGELRTLGEFNIDNERKIVLSSINKFNSEDKTVTGYQYYEIYSSSNKLIEKRKLDIKFKPISDKEFRSMIEKLDLKIIATYGDYSYSEFNEETSNFIIYNITKD